ncbi:MAG TPA: hypothetical protein VMG11_02075 [Steroidobacteraceae bacterium]|nr:hypothetical protein [Steroidobacteraceae bacterium]
MARKRIADGRLPVIFPNSIEASYGSGKTCRLCEQTIQSQHIEYQAKNPLNGHPLSFHLACHAIWQLECRACDLAQDGHAAVKGHADRQPDPIDCHL